MNKSNTYKLIPKSSNYEFVVKPFFKDNGLEFKEIVKDNFTKFILSKYLNK